MEKPADAMIWDKNELQIIDELLADPDHHHDENGETLRLEKSDIVVHKGRVHYGTGDKNPLSQMRFVPRDNLIGPDDDVPEACEVDELDHLTSIPRSFCKLVIRAYCRDPSKLDLLCHVFEDWKFRGGTTRATPPIVNFNVLQQNQGFHQEEDEDSASNDYGGGMYCTQESEDESSHAGTPKKPLRDSNFDMSPIPVASRRF